MNFGRVPRLGEARDSPWEFRSGFWAGEGMRGRRSAPEEGELRLALETPFCAWAVRNATHLPGDYVLFQLGWDQICVLDAPRRRVALLERGRGPVVVLVRDGPPAGPEAEEEGIREGRPDVAPPLPVS